MSHQQHQSQQQHHQQQEEDSDENHQIDLLKSLVILNDIPSLSNLFLSCCDTPEDAIKLLELMIIEIDPCHYEDEAHPEISDHLDGPNGLEEEGDGEDDAEEGHDHDENKKKRPLVYDEEDLQNEFVGLNQHTKIPRPEREKMKQRLSQTPHSASSPASCDGEEENPQTQEEIAPLDHTPLHQHLTIAASLSSPARTRALSSPSLSFHDNRNTVNEMMPFTDVIRDIYDDDASNESIIMTLAVLIPNDMGLSAYIIGKQGANVADIRRKTKARTQLEQPKLIPPGVTERNVFFMGTIRSICEAYQHVFARIISKAETLPAGCLDDLKMVIPTELSALLIGKAGVSIKKIQAESGARTHLQSEDEMMQTGHYYGRVIIISGTLRQRCHAMYLILKNLLAQRDFPDDWRGGMPPLLSLGRQHTPISQGSMQGNRFSFSSNMNMNGTPPLHSHPGQFHPPTGVATGVGASHMLHSPHALPLHPQFHPNMIPDLTNVNLGGPGIAQKWPSPQQQQQQQQQQHVMGQMGSRGPPQISHYPYHPSVTGGGGIGPPGNMMYPPFHQGGLMTFPNQASILHMQSMQSMNAQYPRHLHQQQHAQQQLHQAPHHMQPHQHQHPAGGPPHSHGHATPRAGRENGRGGSNGGGGY